MSDEVVDVKKLLEELDASMEKATPPPPTHSNRQTQINPASPAAQPRPSVGLSRPRTLYYRTIQIVERFPCPNCSNVLRNEFVPYLIHTDTGGREPEPIIATGSFGYFCPSCPSVALNPHSLREELIKSGAIPNPDTSFTVLGVLDLTAVSPDQRHLPFNQLNPLPLVAFRSPTERKGKKRKKDLPPRKKKSRRKRR